ncbi:MAG TPA: HypC/HybG/HupF family hydrogenase formation chaperone [Gaiellaceae bacterium]|nr:HypC/HybG/HupF family hydrogenase formation chaperone [Gaiellaceae bacterium]
MCLGIPAQLVAVRPDGRATAEVSGVRREVSTALVPEARAGDWVLVHVGFALHTIDEDEAARTLALLDELEW